MEDFSVMDAALHGFKVAWERPRALAVWALLRIVVSTPLALATVFYYGPLLMKLQAMGVTGRADPANAVALLAKIGPFYLFCLLFFIAFDAVILAAMNRTVFRPRDDSFGYLRLGSEELRQFWLLALIAGVMLGAYVIGVVVAILVGGLAAAALGAAGVLANTPALFGVAVVMVLMAMIALAVRFSLASPMTFATGKVNLFGAWAITRGRFWPILGVYGLVALLAAVVYLLGYAVVFATAAAVGGGLGAVRDLMTPNLTSLQTFLSPARWIQILLQGALSALVWPLIFTPAAVIYRSLCGSKGVEAVFA